MSRIAYVIQLVLGASLVVAVIYACRPAEYEPVRFGERAHDPATCTACNSAVARIDPTHPLPPGTVLPEQDVPAGPSVDQARGGKSIYHTPPAERDQIRAE